MDVWFKVLENMVIGDFLFLFLLGIIFVIVVRIVMFVENLVGYSKYFWYKVMVFIE